MKFFFIVLTLLLISKITFQKTLCNTDFICQKEINSKYYCNIKTNVCERESLYKFESQYIYGALLIIIISAFANAGGIGGGSVIVPLLTIVFLFDVNEAIPLSKATIFAGAIINICSLVGKRNQKNPNKALIDYKLCAFMLPLMMAGTFIGVYLNFIFPPMIIVLCLTLYLIVSIFSIKQKYQKISEKENEELGVTFSEQLKTSFENFVQDLKLFFNSNSLRNKETNDNEREIPVIELNNINTELKDVKDFNNESITNLSSKSETMKEKINFNENNDKANIKNNLNLFSTTNESISEAKQLYQKSLLEIYKDNLIFISILLISILLIIFLSVLKEGVFFFKRSSCFEMFKTRIGYNDNYYVLLYPYFLYCFLF